MRQVCPPGIKQSRFLRSRCLVDLAHDELHRLITDGELADGERIVIDQFDRKALDHLKAVNRLIASGSYGTTFQAFRDFVTLNERFHVELVAPADDPPLSEAYRRLGYHQQIMRPTYGRGPGDVQRFVREHEDIIAALEAGDAAGAKKAVSQHIASGFERFQLGSPALSRVGAGAARLTFGHDRRRLEDRSVANPRRRKGT